MHAWLKKDLRGKASYLYVKLDDAQDQAGDPQVKHTQESNLKNEHLLKCVSLNCISLRKLHRLFTFLNKLSVIT